MKQQLLCNYHKTSQQLSLNFSNYEQNSEHN